MMITVFGGSTISNKARAEAEKFFTEMSSRLASPSPSSPSRIKVLDPTTTQRALLSSLRASFFTISATVGISLIDRAQALLTLLNLSEEDQKLDCDLSPSFLEGAELETSSSSEMSATLEFLL